MGSRGGGSRRRARRGRGQIDLSTSESSPPQRRPLTRRRKNVPANQRDIFASPFQHHAGGAGEESRQESLSTKRVSEVLDCTDEACVISDSQSSSDGGCGTLDSSATSCFGLDVPVDTDALLNSTTSLSASVPVSASAPATATCRSKRLRRRNLLVSPTRRQSVSSASASSKRTSRRGESFSEGESHSPSPKPLRRLRRTGDSAKAAAACSDVEDIGEAQPR